jgi:hypothetical protein
MSNLMDTQADFADALLSTATPVPDCVRGALRGRAERRFAVYRNNVAVSLLNALGARFPVVARLVGEEFFRAMAREYVMQDPPRSPLLFKYGEGLAPFIEGFAPAAPIPYLADMARLEYARGLAYHAADAEPLPASAFAALDGGRLAEFKVRLHPSVFVIISDYPIVTIWEANQASSVVRISPRGREAALVARPFLEVEMRRLTPGTGAFLASLASGSTLGEAVAAGANASEAFSAEEALATLIGAKIAVDIDR